MCLLGILELIVTKDLGPHILFKMSVTMKFSIFVEEALEK